MAEINILYVDDFVGAVRELYRLEIERYAQILAFNNRIACTLVPSVAWEEMNNILASGTYDLYLIDYELSLKQLDGASVTYKGSTLAEEIRDRFPDKPIVLITRESILDELDYQRRRQLLHQDSVFDELLLKSQLEDNIVAIQEELISLVKGFNSLREQGSKDWKSLFAVLGATDEEEGKLREAAPPVQAGKWIVTEASRWIRHTIMEYPGILYDSLYSATHLGITEEAFLENTIQEIFQNAEYKGSFALPSVRKRWWQDRLFQMAQEFMLKYEVRGNINSGFAKAYYNATSVELAPAICTWDGEPIADWICYVHHEPVKLKYTLRYYPDNRPSVMDAARVSYRAIRENREFQEGLLDAKGLELVKTIEDLDDPRHDK